MKSLLKNINDRKSYACKNRYDYPVIFCALICWIADPMTIQFPVMPF